VDSTQRTITITAYQTPNGKPTCASDFSAGKVCQFLNTKRFGSIEMCGMTGNTAIDRWDGGYGYTIPVHGCPVWSQEDQDA